MSSDSLDPQDIRYQAKLAARAARTVDVIVTPAAPAPFSGGGDARFEAKIEARRLEFKAKAEAEAAKAKATEAPVEAKPTKPASDAKSPDDKPRR